MTDAISIKNVNVKIDQFSILEDINLSIPEKEFLGIIGPNGGGKTTLLKVILGLIKQDSGEVSIYGKTPNECPGLIGYTPQHSNFDKDYPISVMDVVLMGRLGSKTLFGRNSKEDRNIAEESLLKVGLQNYKSRTAGYLSGGEKQRVLIARALSTKPKILLLDEPTASVDSVSGQNFYELLNMLNKEMTIVMVSHDIGAVSQYMNKIACLNKKLVYHDSKEISKEMLEATYQCPVDLIAHGVPHRVYHQHGEHNHV
ncbi:MAG: metal ABC transporter ATP-binding protein [bacterium]